MSSRWIEPYIGPWDHTAVSQLMILLYLNYYQFTRTIAIQNWQNVWPHFSCDDSKSLLFTCSPGTLRPTLLFGTVNTCPQLLMLFYLCWRHLNMSVENASVAMHSSWLLKQDPSLQNLVCKLPIVKWSHHHHQLGGAPPSDLQSINQDSGSVNLPFNSSDSKHENNSLSGSLLSCIWQASRLPKERTTSMLSVVHDASGDGSQPGCWEELVCCCCNLPQSASANFYLCPSPCGDTHHHQ